MNRTEDLKYEHIYSSFLILLRILPYVSLFGRHLPLNINFKTPYIINFNFCLLTFYHLEMWMKGKKRPPYLYKESYCRDAWVAQLVKHLTLDFGPGQDLRDGAPGCLAPHSAGSLLHDSLPPSALPPTRSYSLSLK